jgi:hypothetical protein
MVTAATGFPSQRLQHHAMSFARVEIAAVIKKHIPDFCEGYRIDPVRQAHAESWPGIWTTARPQRNGDGETDFGSGADGGGLWINFIGFDGRGKGCPDKISERFSGPCRRLAGLRNREGKRKNHHRYQAADDGYSERFYLEGYGERAFLRMNSNSYWAFHATGMIAAETAAAEQFGAGPARCVHQRDVPAAH